MPWSNNGSSVAFPRPLSRINFRDASQTSASDRPLANWSNSSAIDSLIDHGAPPAAHYLSPFKRIAWKGKRNDAAPNPLLTSECRFGVRIVGTNEKSQKLVQKQGVLVEPGGVEPPTSECHSSALPTELWPRAPVRARKSQVENHNDRRARAIQRSHSNFDLRPLICAP